MLFVLGPNMNINVSVCTQLLTEKEISTYFIPILKHCMFAHGIALLSRPPDYIYYKVFLFEIWPTLLDLKFFRFFFKRHSDLKSEIQLKDLELIPQFPLIWYQHSIVSIRVCPPQVKRHCVSSLSRIFGLWRNWTRVLSAAKM